MKKYYTGNVKSLRIKELEINKGKVKKIVYEDTVIKTDEWFYTNFLGKLLRFNDDYPLADCEEAKEYLEYQVKNPQKLPSLANLQITYVDSSSLIPQTITKQQEQIMKKEKKLIKKVKK